MFITENEEIYHGFLSYQIFNVFPRLNALNVKKNEGIIFKSCFLE